MIKDGNERMKISENMNNSVLFIGVLETVLDGKNLLISNMNCIHYILLCIWCMNQKSALHPSQIDLYNTKLNEVLTKVL